MRDKIEEKGYLEGNLRSRRWGGRQQNSKETYPVTFASDVGVDYNRPNVLKPLTLAKALDVIVGRRQ